MKYHVKYLLITLAILGLYSCDKEIMCGQDSAFPSETGTDMLAGTLSFACEDPVTRGLPDGAKGNVDWDLHDLRMIVELWRLDGSTLVREQRFVATKDNFDNPVFTFTNVRMLRSKSYKLVCWADVVKQGRVDDFHYLTDELGSGGEQLGLSYVIRRDNLSEQGKTYSGNDDTVDAYTYQFGIYTPVDIFYNANGFAKLRRPLAKIITVGTGLPHALAMVDVTYSQENTYFAFNALSGTPFGEDVAPHYEAAPLNDWNATTKTQTLAWDYLFIPPSGRLSYTILAPNNVAPTAKQVFTDIPVTANKRTYVTGKMRGIYRTGSYYESLDGKVKGVVYRILSDNGLDQTLEIVSLDAANNTPPGVYYQGSATWAQANAYVANKNAGLQGPLWRLASVQDIMNISASISQGPAPYGYAPFNEAIAAHGGTPLDFYGNGGNPAAFRYVAYWTGDNAAGGNADIAWLRPDGVEATTASVPKGESHFGRAVMTLSN